MFDPLDLSEPFLKPIALTCRQCGQEHRAIPQTLPSGHKCVSIRCERCGLKIEWPEQTEDPL